MGWLTNWRSTLLFEWWRHLKNFLSHFLRSIFSFFLSLSLFFLFSFYWSHWADVSDSNAESPSFKQSPTSVDIDRWPSRSLLAISVRRILLHYSVKVLYLIPSAETFDVSSTETMSSIKNALFWSLVSHPLVLNSDTDYSTRDMQGSYIFSSSLSLSYIDSISIQARAIE